MEPDTENVVRFGLDTLEEAGGIALRYFRSELEVTNKAGKRDWDPVTRADREVESFIRERIKRDYPGHRILGEEFGEEGRADAPAWIIDPIDGTRTFICGAPMWGILLGLVNGEECVAGFMHQPFVHETWVGSTAGAYLVRDGKSRRVRTRSTASLAEATVGCTHPSMFTRPELRRAFDRVEAAARLSRFGTECYGYCLLAGGFIDVVVEADLEPYDIIPLIPVVEAAGGVVSDWQGRPALAGGCVAASANASLHEQVLRLLNSAG